MNKKICLIIVFSFFLIFQNPLEANEDMLNDTLISNNSKIDTKISSPNMELEYSLNNYLEIKLEDSDNNTLSNKTIDLRINNGDYSLLTNQNGSAKFKIDLEVGNYSVFFKFNDNEFYNPSNSTSNLIILKGQTQIIINDTSFNKKGDYLELIVTNQIGSRIINKEVTITINGVDYLRLTDNAGIAKIRINLNPGTYTAKFSIEDSKKYYGTIKTINLNILESSEKLDIDLIGYDLIQDYGEGNSYTVFLKDNNGKNLVNVSINFIINGVTYTRITDSEGIGKIKINLNPGNYNIESIFENDYYNTKSVTNSITVKLRETQLIGDNLTHNYNDKDYFKVQLLTKTNKTIINTDVIISINGVNYTRTTFNDGFAFLRINLSPGTYNVITYYLGDDRTKKSLLKTTLTVLKHNTSILTNDLILNIKGEYLEAILVNGYNQPLANEIVEITINNIIYSRITDSDGIARIKINLDPGKYSIYYNFNGNDFYKSNNTSSSILVYNENVKIDSKLKAANSYISIKGNKLGISLKNVNNLPIANELIEIVINNVSYYRETNSEGIAYLSINLMSKSYNIFYLFNGSNRYNPSQGESKLVVSYDLNLFYSFNISTVVDGESELLNKTIKIPVSRMINITTSDGDYNLWYKFIEAKNFIDVVDIKENITYFIPFNNPSKEILILSSISEIIESGISLVCFNESIEIKYYGHLENDLNKFDIIFKCNNISDVGYETLELILNNKKIASINFTSPIFGTEPRLILQLTQSKVVLTHEIIETELKTAQNTISKSEQLSYGKQNYYANLPGNYWNPEIDYDIIQSNLITNRKITNEDVDYFLKNLKENNNIEKVTKENFLAALSVYWMYCMANEELADIYNITWNVNNFNTISSGLNFHGKYINTKLIASDNDYEGSLEGIEGFKFLSPLILTAIEEFSLELNGYEARGGLSDVITCILNGEPFSFIDYGDYQIISPLNSSSSIYYFKNTGYTSTLVYQADNTELKGSVGPSSGYLYPTTVTLNFNQLSSGFQKVYDNLGKSFVNLLNYKKKVDYELVTKGIAAYGSGKLLLSKSPDLIGFMTISTEFMCGIRDTFDYEDWRYFGVYPVWKGKTFQFVSENKVTYTNIWGQEYEGNDQIHVIIPYKNEWTPLGENELDRDNAYIISDAYGRVNITAEESYHLEAESDAYYIKNGHRWVSEIDD